MIRIQFLATAVVIVFAGVRLARYRDVLGEESGLGRSWIGVVLLAATTSLPELFTGFGATALASLPNIAIGDVLGSCMFNLLILSFMDAVQPEPASTRAHQGHALSIGFGIVLIGIAVDSLRWDNGRAYESQHVIQPTIAQRQNIAEI
jgi:cation:H+ antiporter